MEEQVTSSGEEPQRQPLAARMKDYEAATEIHLEPSQPAILRLDGHNFSRFTRRFAKPFDDRLHTAMVRTCADLLVEHPGATLAYTQSDEITLIFPSGVGSFSDRVMKIATLAAGFCSVHFYTHLMKALEETPEPMVKDFASLPLPHFDGRLFNVPSVEECLNNIIWRCRGDAIRNSISAFARGLFSAKQLHGKNKNEMVEMAKQEKGIIFRESVPPWAPEGSIVKKKLVKTGGVDAKTGKAVTVVRMTTHCDDRGMTNFSEENLALVRDKYWPDS
ncbi:tRNAHis guanylyltransferase-domain-containing protein [Mariannaea sp. PMI_226]|nr:tRNAHis guanylyltransferase-domain-containing protein [Mariannaea sp. PMI_226]